MTVFLIALSVALAAAWVPILLKFIRSWRARRNPVSLAICGAILLSIYSNILAIAVFAFDGNATTAAIATHVFNGMVCVNFYFAFLWASRKFSDDRRPPAPSPPNS